MRKSKGFTLIELMIVVAIIAIIAAIAIPNLMQSRIRANEATAISVTKQIAAAQVQWQVARLSRNADNSVISDNSYCDYYRNLYYGEQVGGGSQPVALISKAAADADSGAVIAGHSPLNGNTGGAATPAEAYQGYHFVEPLDCLPADWDTTFAIVAFPNNSSRTGTNSYYLGEDGTVYMMGLASNLQQSVAADVATMRGITNIMDPSKMTTFLGAGWGAL